MKIQALQVGPIGTNCYIFCDGGAKVCGIVDPGGGPEVADCGLLFGCRHANAFPVDVWVKRLMADWFGVTGSPAFLAREARRMFGEGCGLIQQSLFHAARVGLIETGGKTA